MFCKNCGKEVNDNAAFCPECGAVVNPSANSGYEGGMVASTNLEGGMGAVPPPKKQKAPQNKKSSKSTIAIIILSALLVIAALVIVIILQNNKLNEKPDNKSRNTTGEMEFLSQQNYPAWNDEKPEIELTTTEVTHPVFDEPIEETTTSIEVVTNRDGEKVTNNRGEAVTEVVTQKPTTNPSTTKPVTTAKPTSSKPSTKTEIVNYFNTAMNNVKSGAKSVKQHSVVNYLAGTPVISQGLLGIYNTLGGDAWLDKMLRDNSAGTATYSGSNIKAKFPVEGQSWSSKLSSSDVSSATCTESNGIYTIKIKTVADSKSSSVSYGQGHNPKVFTVPLPGTINENIPGIAKGLVGNASMNYPSGTVTIKVDVKTGKVLSAEYDAHWTINFDKMDTVLPLATKSSYTINW